MSPSPQGKGVPLPLWGGGHPPQKNFQKKGDTLPRKSPLPRKILMFSSQNGEFWCNMQCYLQRFTTAFTSKLKLQQHTVPYHNTIYAYLSHIQFLVRKTGCIWVLTSSCTAFVPFRDSAYFATSCLHLHNVDVPCTDIAIACRAQQRKPGCAFHEPKYKML